MLKISNVILVAIIAAIIIMAVMAISLSFAPQQSPSQQINAFIDAVNRHDAGGMVNCTVLRFSTTEYDSETLHAKDYLSLDYFVFILNNISIITKDKMDALDRTVAKYDIIVKNESYCINITNYCRINYNVTRITDNTLAIPLFGESKVISRTIMCYEVNSSWYLIGVDYDIFFF